VSDEGLVPNVVLDLVPILLCLRGPRLRIAFGHDPTRQHFK